MASAHIAMAWDGDVGCGGMGGVGGPFGPWGGGGDGGGGGGDDRGVNPTESPTIIAIRIRIPPPINHHFLVDDD